MEKRFIEVGTMQAQRDEQCPLLVEKVLIIKDSENDVWFLTPHIKNEYESAVSMMTVGYVAYDENQTVIEKESGYVIDEIEQDEEGHFGEDLPITLEKVGVCDGRFFIEEVVFEKPEAAPVANEKEQIIFEDTSAQYKQETIVDTIPSRTKSQDTYKDYDNLFADIRRRTGK